MSSRTKIFLTCIGKRIQKSVVLILLSMSFCLTIPLADASTTLEKKQTSLFDEAIMKVAKQGVKITSITVDQKQSTALIVAEDKNHTVFTYDFDLTTKTLIGRDSPTISIVNQAQINQSVKNMKRLIALAQKNGGHLRIANNDGDSGMFISVSDSGVSTMQEVLFNIQSKVDVLASLKGGDSYRIHAQMA